MRLSILATAAACMMAVPAHAAVTRIGISGIGTISQTGITTCIDPNCSYQGPALGSTIGFTFTFFFDDPIPRIGSFMDVFAHLGGESAARLDLVNARPVEGRGWIAGRDDPCGGGQSLSFVGRSIRFDNEYCQQAGGIERVSYSVGGTITGYSINGVSVPEPATWALMILGFGAVGGAMRRRARVAAVA